MGRCVPISGWSEEPNPQPAPITCPDGYILNAVGQCVQLPAGGPPPVGGPPIGGPPNQPGYGPINGNGYYTGTIGIGSANPEDLAALMAALGGATDPGARMAIMGNIYKALGSDFAAFTQMQLEFTDVEKRLAEEFTAQYGLDVAKLSETSRQFNVSTQQQQAQFGARLAFDTETRALNATITREQMAQDMTKFDLQLGENQRQFAARFGLDERAFDESIRQFDLSTEEGRRQFNESMVFQRETLQFQREAEEQRNTLGQSNMILNAPRGPADFWAYAARLQGLRDNNMLTNTLRRSIEGATGTSINQLSNTPVLTNTQLAQDLAGASSGRPASDLTRDFLRRTLGTSSATLAAMDQTATAQAQAQAQAARAQGTTAGAAGAPVASPDARTAAPAAPAGAGATTMSPGTPMATAAGTPTGGFSMPTGFQTSVQDFARLDPTLQEMYIGAQGEFGGQTRQDFLAGLVRGAPKFAKSAETRLG